jgi:F0F1-type ATP synthase delta subunit
MEQDAFGRIEVDVFTASGSIDAATQATLVGDLTRSLGKQPVLHFYADPAMIGGLQLRRMRSTLIDKGLAGRDAGAFLS